MILETVVTLLACAIAASAYVHFRKSKAIEKGWVGYSIPRTSLAIRGFRVSMYTTPQLARLERHRMVSFCVVAALFAVGGISHALPWWTSEIAHWGLSAVFASCFIACVLRCMVHNSRSFTRSLTENAPESPRARRRRPIAFFDLP